MKKNIKILLSTTIIFLSVITVIFASSVTVRIGSQNLSRNGTTTITVKISDPEGFVQGTVSTSGGVTASPSSFVSNSNVQEIKVTASSSGSVSVKGFGVDTGGKDRLYFDENYAITVDDGGNSGNNGNNGNSGSTGGTKPGTGDTKPGTSNPGTTKPDKELTEEEKKAKEEAEKKAQLEANQKIPLVDGIKITSRSPKMEGVALETLGTEEGTFSYSYELPKNIDRVGLELLPAIDGVELTYDKEIDFAADETSKIITANAKSGEISQDYEIVLTRTIPVVNKTEIDGKKLTVLDDETLDGNMKTLGFERQEYEIEGGMGYFFVNGDIKLQLLVDENNNGSWHLLDESNKPSEEVILLESGTNYALVMNAPEAMQKETLNTEKYSEKTVDFESRYTEVSTTLVMNNKYKAWTAEDGEVFYGIMNGGEKRLHFKTKNEDGLVFEKAFVGFDHTSGTSKTVAIVSTATLGIAVISGVIYTIILKKKK